MEIFDIGIIGSGVAGTFAALRIAERYKELKTVLFELGRSPGKRRRQLEGFLGSLPSGDGKLYTNNINTISEICDGRKVHHASTWLFNYLQEFGDLKLIKDTLPNVSTQKKIKNAGFSIKTNDYYQWKPNNIHALAKDAALKLEEGNINLSFENEIISLSKKKNLFFVQSSLGEFVCKKILLASGRSGWRWATELFKEFNICSSDDFSYYGLRLEISRQYLKDFNKSHCHLFKDDLEIGPFSWNGSVLPEDHADLVISSFRSNEERWKSEKVSFNITKKIRNEGKGVYESDRLAKLVFLLFNDRIGKEKIKAVAKNQSQLNILKEFKWLIDDLNIINSFIPELINKGSFHAPHIIPMPGEIKLSSDLETEIPGLYVAGENAGVFGIVSAALTGLIAADSLGKNG